MKAFFNFTFFISIVTIACILHSGKWFADFCGPQTDLLIAFIGVIVGLILALITSKISLRHKKSSTAFWDIMFDTVSLNLHIISVFSWKYIEIPIMNAKESEIISIFLIVMTFIAFLELVLTTRNAVTIKN